MDKKKQLAQVIMGIATMYKAEFTQPLIDLWMLVMEPYDARDVQNAFVMHMRDSDQGMFAPKPANLIRQIERAQTSAAGLAMMAIDLATRTTSARHGVAFEDPLIHVAMLSIGGWPRAYSELTNSETCGEYKSEFGKAYARAKISKEAHVAFLQGVNSDMSFATIGDEQKVNATVASGYSPKKILQLA